MPICSSELTAADSITAPTDSSDLHPADRYAETFREGWGTRVEEEKLEQNGKDEENNNKELRMN